MQKWTHCFRSLEAGFGIKVRIKVGIVIVIEVRIKVETKVRVTNSRGGTLQIGLGSAGSTGQLGGR
jgi:hypothetical protein